jgi:hypothetical protein
MTIVKNQEMDFGTGRTRIKKNAADSQIYVHCESAAKQTGAIAVLSLA